ncbi:MAG: hypothetical protein IJ221_05470 [Oscillibacter sp.]|nr:hypothetical protein [Oscillibacter sp.]
MFSYDQLHDLVAQYDINISEETIFAAVEYIRLRADILNNQVRRNLMTGEEAKRLYDGFIERFSSEELVCKIPRNLQTRDKDQTSYFSALINMITELHIKYNTETWQFEKPGFDCDPHGLIYVFNQEDDSLIGACSRRFDGAFPITMNAEIIWEIKEYYYTTTFGSRIADGVYETELDGFELNEIYRRTGKKIFHVLLVDAYDTWWRQGRSYLCRIIDALNSGLVDEVIFGREIFTRWPEFLKEHIYLD